MYAQFKIALNLQFWQTTESFDAVQYMIPSQGKACFLVVGWGEDLWLNVQVCGRVWGGDWLL